MTEIDREGITRFWINSLGEFGHDGENGATLSIHGSVNLGELLAEVEPHMTLDMLLKREFDSDLHQGTLDAREVALYRAWEQFNSDDGTFRFHAVLPWEFGKPVRGGAELYMTQEYILDEAEHELLDTVVTLFAQTHHIGMSIDSMWEDFDDPSRTQYAVNFNILGRSKGEVLALQIAWEDIAEKLFETLEERKVTVA